MYVCMYVCMYAHISHLQAPLGKLLHIQGVAECGDQISERLHREGAVAYHIIQEVQTQLQQGGGGGGGGRRGRKGGGGRKRGRRRTEGEEGEGEGGRGRRGRKGRGR